MPHDSSKHIYILPSMGPLTSASSTSPTLEEMSARLVQPPERLVRSRKDRGLRIILSCGKNVCFFCRSPRRHKLLCPTRMKRVRSDYHMFVPGLPLVARSIAEPLPIASPRILELELPPSNLEPLTRSVATQTMPPETEETDVAISSAGDEDERAHNGVRTESEARLFQYFIARCPSEDFGDIATQWNALLHAWRAADCLEVRLATGLVTMTDVTLKTADHLAVHAAIERAANAIGPPTSEASTKHQVVVGTSALASTSRLRKRQYLPCPHCGHKTRRHTKDLARTCELYQFYRQRNVATSNGYSFENAIEDFAQQQDSEPEASSASYIV